MYGKEVESHVYLRCLELQKRGRCVSGIEYSAGTGTVWGREGPLDSKVGPRGTRRAHKEAGECFFLNILI